VNFDNYHVTSLARLGELLAYEAPRLLHSTISKTTSSGQSCISINPNTLPVSALGLHIQKPSASMPGPEVGNRLNRVRGAARPGSDPPLPPASPAAPSTRFTLSAYQPSPSSLPHPPSSPQTTNPELKRSRARATKSCQRCRAKKLKCDRVLPCSNCTKGERDGSECTFIYGPGIEDARVMEEAHQRGMKKFRVERPSDQHIWDRLQAPHPEVTQTQSPGYGGYNVIPSASNGISDGNRPPLNYLTPYPAMHTPGTGYGESPVSMPAVSQSRSDIPSAPLGRIQARGSRTRYSSAGNRMEIMDHVSIAYVYFYF
jgi:hypothetical protein